MSTAVNRQDLFALANRINRTRRNDVVAIDTETSGIEGGPWANQLQGLSLALPGDAEGVYIPVGHRLGQQADHDGLRAVGMALTTMRARQGWHHAQFDWAFMEEQVPGFIHEPRRYTDTLVARWLQDENVEKGLKPLADAYLGADSSAEQAALKVLMKPPIQKFSYPHVRAEFPELPVVEARTLARELSRRRGWDDLWPHELSSYAAQDAVLTRDLTPLLVPNPDWGPLRRELDLQDQAYRMRRRGIRLDPVGLAALKIKYRTEADVIREELRELAGADIDVAEEDLDATVASSKKLGNLLYERLGLPILERSAKTDAPSTSALVLETLHHPVTEKVLELRRKTKLITSYCTPLERLANISPDGRIHAEFNTVGTVTGRWTCSGPNFQQIPRDDTAEELRVCFVPGPGLELWEFDLNSAELWVGASITRDPMLTAFLVEGRDMHTEVAEAIFGRSDGRWRTLAKNMGYGMNYGAGPKQLARFAAKAGMDRDAALSAAVKFWRGHKRLYRRFHAVGQILADRAGETGRLPMHMPGRYRHFRSPGFRNPPTYTALNSLIQGGVAEFMENTMAAVDEGPYGDKLLLQVHDSLVCELEPGEGPLVLAHLQQISNELSMFHLPMTWSGKNWRK